MSNQNRTAKIELQKTLTSSSEGRLKVGFNKLKIKYPNIQKIIYLSLIINLSLFCIIGLSQTSNLTEMTIIEIWPVLLIVIAPLHLIYISYICVSRNYKLFKESEKSVPDSTDNKIRSLIKSLRYLGKSKLLIIFSISGIGLLYIFTPVIKNIIKTEFTITEVYIHGLLYVIIFYIISASIRHYNHKNQVDYIFKNATLIGISSIMLVNILFILLLYLRFSKDIDRKLYNNNNDDQKTVVLVTEFNPIISRSPFSMNFEDINVSSSFYQKILTIKGFSDNQSTNNPEITIEYLNRPLKFNEEKDYWRIHNKVDAIITGDIINQENDIRLINNLLITSNSLQSVITNWENKVKNSQKPLEEYDSTFTAENSSELSDSSLRFSFYYDGPIKYCKYNANTYITDESMIQFINQPDNFHFDISNSFPSALTITSSIEKSPRILFKYIFLLSYIRKNDCYLTTMKKDTTISKKKKKAIIDEVISPLGELISVVSFGIIPFETKPNEEIFSSVAFLVHLYMLRAYYYNLAHQNDDSNIESFFNKTNDIFLAGYYYLFLNGYNFESLKEYKIIHHLGNYRGMRCIEFPADRKYFQKYSSNFKSKIEPDLRKTIASLSDLTQREYYQKYYEEFIK